MSVSDFVVSMFLHYRVGHQHRNREVFNYYKYPDLSSNCIHASDLPECDPDHIRIVVVSDTHNRHESLDYLPPCDILVHCGDVLMTGRRLSPESQKKIFENFDTWMGSTPSNNRIFVAGNHDHILGHHVSSKEERKRMFRNAEYVENDILHMDEGISIYATPLSMGASGNRAFQSSEFLDHTIEKANRARNHLNEVDILLTHGFGSGISDLIPHNLHLCGHFHKMYGVSVVSVLQEYEGNVWREKRLKAKTSRSSSHTHEDSTTEGIKTGKVIAKQVRICAAICDGDYNLSNPPIVVDYPRSSFIRK